ncbi:S-adenosyl-L-methionine-dependent methyltransferase [Limtongia smithiae]|uniref:S-adenosyl-L-methionine-dependent methyltransferase n=1 Tax=Limtongia smithiae TaxID=1125753 RepID=UPI0034CFF308
MQQEGSLPPNHTHTHRRRPHDMSRNRVVQATDTDALLTKAAAAHAGYFVDAYLDYFVMPVHTQPGGGVHKLPLINRGTYVRVATVSRLVDAFVKFHPEGGTKVQIVSLGAGSDTRPFHTFKIAGSGGLVYHELDFASSAAHKAGVIARHQILRDAIPGDLVFDIGSTTTTPSSRRRTGQLTSALRPDPSAMPDITIPASSPGIYYLHGIDLRTLTTPSRITTALTGFDPTLPTLILSECCLCYLEPSTADAVLASFVRALAPGTSVGIISYEPFTSDDSFGTVMVNNLAARGISIPAMMEYTSLGAQLARLRGLLLNSYTPPPSDTRAPTTIAGAAADLKFVHDKWTSPTDLARIDDLEILDEREEFDLLARHYGFYWAAIGPSSTPTTSPFPDAFSSWNPFSHQIFS